MNDFEELNARMEECKSDLFFYLCYKERLAKVSPSMKAVVEKEIKRLEEEIAQLAELLRH